MGMVYKARQPRLKSLVALKLLPAESGRDAAIAGRFAREAATRAEGAPKTDTKGPLTGEELADHFQGELVASANIGDLIRNDLKRVRIEHEGLGYPAHVDRGKS